MNPRRMCKLMLLSFLLLLIASCQMGQEKDRSAKGAAIPMETYYIGRFSIGVPIDMKQTAREHMLRDTKIKEAIWPEGKSHDQARKEAWDKFIEQIRKKEPPEGKKEVLLKRENLERIGRWANAILYYKDDVDDDEGIWTMLLDSKTIEVWLNTVPVLIEKDNKSNNAINNLTTIAKAYCVSDPNTPKPKGDWFYLQHGAINLPYKWQERSYVRFEGHPLKFTIEVKMNETYKVEPGINERTSSEDSKLMARVLGVSVDRIRTGKRVVAGLEGEEELDRISDKKGTDLSFKWEYAGKENSGEHPEILIKMYSADGNLDEKLKIWDAVLNSMKPMYK